MEKIKGVGASEVADLFSLEWGCEKRLYYKKTDVEPDYPRTTDTHMQRGIALEDDAAELFSKETGLNSFKLKDGDNYFKHGLAPLHGKIDRFVVEQDGTDGKQQWVHSILEIKVPAFYSFKEIKEKGLPETYILQMQAYLSMNFAKDVDTSFGRFAILHADSWQLLSFIVKKDEELIDKIIKQAFKFWSKVKTKKEPNRLEMDDRRCKTCSWRKTCWADDVSIVEGMKLVDKDAEDMTSNPDLAMALEEYMAAKSVLEVEAERKDEAELKIKSILGDRQLVRHGSIYISWKGQQKHLWDLKALEEKHPDLKKKFEKVSQTRVFKIIKKGEQNEC